MHFYACYPNPNIMTDIEESCSSVISSCYQNFNRRSHHYALPVVNAVSEKRYYDDNNQENDGYIPNRSLDQRLTGYYRRDNDKIAVGPSCSEDYHKSAALEQGMSASFNYTPWWSTTGLDDAGMDLRVAQFSAHTSREHDTAATTAGLGKELPVFLALCTIAGAVLFAFLILIWLRQQMSREKDAEESDRRGLVAEEGRICPVDDNGAKNNTNAKALTEVKWVTSESAPETTIVVGKKLIAVGAAESTITTTTTTTTTAAAAAVAAVEFNQTITNAEQFSALFERVKVKTERQWVPEVVANSSVTCSEPASSDTTASSTAVIPSNEPISATSSVSSVTLASLKMSLAATSSSTSSTSSSRVTRKIRSPRRDCGNRRTLSMYSPHVSAIVATPERKPGERRGKNLLERRGSSASLTIELGPTTESLPNIVTPTREYSDDEYLLSTGNTLTREQLKKAIEDPSTLHKEFWNVPLNYPEEVNICGSGMKNRYCSVLPNPRSRVVLPGSDDPFTTYINANYVRGFDDETRYIATQGPLSHTIQDFWSMAWAERSPVIVMMTRLHEATKTKCEAYFPLEINSRLQAGNFTIILNSMDTRGGYVVRDLEIRHGNERRTIQHYWYDSWPDHAVPPSADALVGLAAEINAQPGPIIVHCSAGIGRTGCFIALATGMTQLVRDGSVDVLGILCQMRYDRGGMVQTAEQYEFVHKALCLFEETLEHNQSKNNKERG